jgi:preprotein translocase subunit SecE
MNQPMNREQKRLLQRRGSLGADGAPAPQEKRERVTKGPTQTRTSPIQFVREVRSELGKVAWPTRTETVNYSLVVFFALSLLIAAIFGLDYVSAKGALFLFK